MQKYTPRRSLIFLIFGASGSGKSTLTDELVGMGPWVSTHTKGTDRPSRRYDGEEILCEPNILPSKYDYIYSQYGHKYGIQRRQIDAAVQKGQHHFIICNDVETIEAIRRDYGDSVRVVFLRFDSPRETLLVIQKSRRISDDEINLRLEKIRVLNQTFVDHSDLFDAVIINKFGAPPSKMITQLQRIIAAEETCSGGKNYEIQRGFKEIVNTVSEIERRLHLHAEQLGGVVQSDYIFILMAMLKTDPLLQDAHAAIKRVASRLCLRAERIDDIAHIDQINDKVLGSIRCAEYIIADLTHERPNVYYELGYAHAFGKKTILTAREGTNLHFDIRNYPVIFYSSSVQLEDEVVKFLSKLEQKRHRVKKIRRGK